jgi:hypothetical protein
MPAHRMRLGRTTGLVPGLLTAIALALSTSGCGSASVALDPVAQAADVTSQAGGAHMALTAQVSAAGLSSPLTISGQGFFNYKTQEGMFALDMSGLPTTAAANLASGTLHIEEVFKSGAIYIGSPLFAGKLPGGARWMKLDLARVGQVVGLNLQQLASGQSNPAQFLEYLKASGGTVTPVGHDLVRGVPTTHYRGTIDLTKVAGVMPSGNRTQLRAALAKVIAETGVSRLPVEVWVDSARLVRRMTIALSLPAAGQRLQMRMSIDLFAFGATPAVTPPPGGEVYDATQAALAGLSASGG